MKGDGQMARDTHALNDLQAISPAEAAAAIGVKPAALENWRKRGGGPPFIRISSKCVRYRVRDLREWQEARLRVSNSG